MLDSPIQRVASYATSFSALFTTSAACLCGLLTLGCSGQLPAVKPPSIDIKQAATGALAEFDADGNGSIEKAEACMGMKTQWDRYDADGDGSITSDELTARFEKWTGGDTGMMNLRAQLKLRGQPLTDANVTMTPYEFLGDNVLASEGVSDPYGYAFMAVPKENLPASQQSNFGMQVGLFRVSITHPDKKISAKYNDESELSVDLSPNEANTGVMFNLK